MPARAAIGRLLSVALAASWLAPMAGEEPAAADPAFAAFAALRRAERDARDPDTYDQALSEYEALLGGEWLARRSAFQGMAKLGGRFQPALAALKVRREAARLALAGDHADVDSFRTCKDIDDALGDQAASVALFTGLDASRPAIAAAVYPDMRLELVAARRFELCNRLEREPVVAFRKTLELLGVLPRPDGLAGTVRDAIVRQQVVRELEALCEILVAGARDRELTELTDAARVPLDGATVDECVARARARVEEGTAGASTPRP